MELKKEPQFKILDEDGKPVMHLNLEVELGSDFTSESSALINGIKVFIESYMDRMLEEGDEKKRDKVLTHTKCPITGVPVDGGVQAFRAIQLGLITKQDRKDMKNKRRFPDNHERFHEYSEYNCTMKYKRGLDVPFEYKSGLLTIEL